MCKLRFTTGNKKKHLCRVWGCINEKLHDRLLCQKHSNVWRKVSSPYKYHFNCLKQNAKRRGKEFTLTIDEFISFCDKTDYLENVGRGEYDFSIDRIRQDEGYHYNNIQVLSNYDNRQKYIQYIQSS